MDSQASDLHPDAASGNPQRAQQSIETEASYATIDIPDSLYNQPPDFRGLSSDFLNENAEFLQIHVDDESQTTDYSYSSTCVPKRLQKLIFIILDTGIVAGLAAAFNAKDSGK